MILRILSWKRTSRARFSIPTYAKKFAIPFHSDFAFSCRPIVSPELYPIPKFVCTPCMHRIPTPWQGKPLQLTLSSFLLTQFSCHQVAQAVTNHQFVWSGLSFEAPNFSHFWDVCQIDIFYHFLKEDRFTFWAISYILAVSSVRWILKQKGNYWALPWGSVHVWGIIVRWRH